MHKLAVILL